MNKKMKPLLMMIILIIVVLQLILPDIVYAAAITINVTHSEANPKNITVTVNGTTEKIVELKYINKYIDKTEVNCFINNETGVVIVPIIENISITKDFTLEYGEYTFYAKDAYGNVALYRTTVKETVPPNLNVSKEGMTATITATDVDSNIEKVMVGKRTDANTAFDFSSGGTQITITPNKSITTSYTATEAGVYDFYVEDACGNISTLRKIALSTEKILSLSVTNTGKELNITATGSVAKIVKLKIALLSEASTKEDFATKGENIAIVSDKNVNVKYTLKENGIYSIYAEDELGNITITTKVVADDNISFSVNKDTTVIGKYDISATSESGSVTKIEIAYSDKEDASSEELSYEAMNIESGKKVDTSITKITDKNIYAYFKVTTSEGKTKTFILPIEKNSIDTDTTPPEITLTEEPTDSGIIKINVKELATYIKEIKYAEGNKEKQYFETNGENINIQANIKELNTILTVNKSGVYTVYASDKDGNSSISTIMIDIKKIEDTIPPNINITQNTPQDNKVLVQFDITDDSSTIAILKVDSGNKAIEYFENAGINVPIKVDGKTAKGEVTAIDNGTYTVYAEDSSGNKTVKTFTVSGLTNENNNNNTTNNNTTNNNTTNNNTINNNTINNNTTSNNTTNNNTTNNNTTNNNTTNNNTTNNNTTNNNTTNNNTTSNNTLNNNSTNTNTSNNNIIIGNSSNYDNTTATGKIPQTGENYIGIILLLIISGLTIVEIKRYKNKE